MPQTCKTPAVEAGASRDSCGGRSQPLSTLDAYRAQFLTAAFAVRPEMAVMVAALAFGGGHGHG